VATVAAAAAYFLLFRKKATAIALDKDTWKKFKLVEKTAITAGVMCPVTRFRFQLDHPNQVLGLPIGKHISLRCKTEEDKWHQRSYTPVTSDDEKGYFDLIIKIYPKGVMGQHLANMKIGESIEVRGPKGMFDYATNKYKHLCLLAGGSGITPMFQIMTEISKRSDDNTKVSLLYGNITEQDIILRKELDALVKSGNERFTAYHVLNDPPQSGWTQGSGFITRQQMESNFPKPKTNGLKILLCGPPPMNAAMQKLLEEIGYSPEEIFQF